MDAETLAHLTEFQKGLWEDKARWQEREAEIFTEMSKARALHDPNRYESEKRAVKAEAAVSPTGRSRAGDGYTMVMKPAERDQVDQNQNSYVDADELPAFRKIVGEQGNGLLRDPRYDEDQARGVRMVEAAAMRREEVRAREAEKKAGKSEAPPSSPAAPKPPREEKLGAHPMPASLGGMSFEAMAQARGAVTDLGANLHRSGRDVTQAEGVAAPISPSVPGTGRGVALA